MTHISRYLANPLTDKRVVVFDKRLVSTHIQIKHGIMPIPKGYTLMDALAFVFNDDVLAMSDVIQDYADNNGFAVDLLDALEVGILNRSICLTCVARGVHAFGHRQENN
jgi:hypothetical protein